MDFLLVGLVGKCVSLDTSKNGIPIGEYAVPRKVLSVEQSVVGNYNFGQFVCDTERRHNPLVISGLACNRALIKGAVAISNE